MKRLTVAFLILGIFASTVFAQSTEGAIRDRHRVFVGWLGIVKTAKELNASPAGLTAASFDIFSLRSCSCGLSSRETKKGLAELEGIVALPGACSKIPVALFGTPLPGARVRLVRTVENAFASFTPIGIARLKVLNPVWPKRLHQPLSFPSAGAIDALLGVVDELENHI